MSKYTVGEEIAPEDIKPGMTIRTTETLDRDELPIPYVVKYEGVVERTGDLFINFFGDLPRAFLRNNNGIIVTHTLIAGPQLDTDTDTDTDTEPRVGWYLRPDGSLRWWDGKKWGLPSRHQQTHNGSSFGRPLLDPTLPDDIDEMNRIVKEKR